MSTASPTRAWRVAVLYALLWAASGALLFVNLDNHLLWGDEAETAVLARNILSDRVPRTVDALGNRITLYGSDLDSNAEGVWILSPWLQEYVAAASFRLFGTTTWAARALFAGVGWLCLLLLAFTAYHVYRDHRVALTATLLLATSEVFLLHVRQCRYHALTLCGEILLTLGLYRMLRRGGQGFPALPVVALTMQFYSNYMIAAANLPLLVVLGWRLSARDPRALRAVLAGGLVFAAAITPWLVYAQPWRHVGTLTDEPAVDTLAYYLREFHFHFLPWAFLLLPLAGRYTTRWRAAERGTAPAHRAAVTPLPPVASFERLLLLLLLLYIGMLVFPPGSYLRYLLPLMPVACLLTAAWVVRYLPWPPLVALLLVVQCGSNGLAVVTALPFGSTALRWPLVEYARGLSHRYEDRFSDVLAFLQPAARAGETVYVADPEFPLMFYTSLRIIDARLAGEAVPDPLPNWILSESASGVFPGRIALPPWAVGHYDTLVIPVRDSPRGGSMPQPELFQYATTDRLVQMTIYRRRDGR